MNNSFGSRSKLRVGAQEYEIYRLDALEKINCTPHRLPFSLRILLENLLRTENGRSVTADDIRFLADWKPQAIPEKEISFTPARVLMQDFTGVPAVVDLAAMRDAMKAMGGDPNLINPLQPAELVIDHSVQVDEFANSNAFAVNARLEFKRNRERYAFLRWGQSAFRNFKAVPPDMGIVHQVNLEYLARVVFSEKSDGVAQAYPDTLVGTDSHTTMINGLGVLGWGVGGIEAEAAMLGQPVSMLVPQVVGFKLTGSLHEGATATDLVLTVTEMLRKTGVVGKFVEFFGPGLDHLALADRATIANMAPEYGATCGIFPVDQITLNYLRMTGRDPQQITLVEAYCKEQGFFRTAQTQDAEYSQVVELDLGTVEPSVAGPRRPQDRVPLSQARQAFEKALCRRHIAHIADDGLDDDGGQIVFASTQKRIDALQIVIPSDNDVAHNAFGNSAAFCVGGVRRCAGVEQREIEMAVIIARKFQNEIAARIRARDANRAHDGFGPGTHEAHAFHRGQILANAFG